MSLAERPEVVQLDALQDATELLHAYAVLGRGLLERVGPLMLPIAAGARPVRRLSSRSSASPTPSGWSATR